MWRNADHRTCKQIRRDDGAQHPCELPVAAADLRRAPAGLFQRGPSLFGGRLRRIDHAVIMAQTFQFGKYFPLENGQSTRGGGWFALTGLASEELESPVVWLALSPGGSLFAWSHRPKAHASQPWRSALRHIPSPWLRSSSKRSRRRRRSSRPHAANPQSPAESVPRKDPRTRSFARLSDRPRLARCAGCPPRNPGTRPPQAGRHESSAGPPYAGRPIERQLHPRNPALDRGRGRSDGRHLPPRTLRPCRQPLWASCSSAL